MATLLQPADTMVELNDRQGTQMASLEILDSDACMALLLQERTETEAAVIRRACELAQRAHKGQKRASGEPYYQHALAAATILAGLHMDYETIAAAILHDVVEDTPVSLQDIKDQFGPEIATLVDGVTKMGLIQGYPGQLESHKKERVRAESLRKMLLAMAADVRVVLIKLADRLHNMRTLGALPQEKCRRIARETMEIFAPLANRLGIWQIKWELEDLSFRYLEPDNYKQIAAMLVEKRADREQYISRFTRRLSEELARANIEAEVIGRAKHIYGIWRKMQRKEKGFHEIYDLRAVRIFVKQVSDCYAALGIVHTLWQYIPGEFDDYIATPKENNYRSIHTAIIGPEGKTVEVQIRTHDMHRQSEYGVAAHWRYKEGAKSDASYDEKISWLRQILEWKEELAEASDFVDQFKSEVFSDRVYVFTPKGNVIDMPHGATPLDFAYHVHTEVGHRCRGAKVNGKIVPLVYQLKTGEQVEVLTVKKGGPSRDWLNPHLGYLHSSKARSKVQQWFRHQNYENNVTAGRTALERELKRLGLTDVNYEKLAQRLKFSKLEDFLAAVGRGDVKATQMLNALQSQDAVLHQAIPSSRQTQKKANIDASSSIQVQGVGSLLTTIARCCKPLPGDPIIGYITRGQGVSVHRQDCRNVLRYRNEARERLLEVNWGAEKGDNYPVDIQLSAYDRHGLLRDVTTLLSNEKINLLAVNTHTDKKLHIATMTITIEVPDINKLSRILVQLEQLPNVTQVHRRRS